ncbi:MAG TPA: BTAD domain-containing putative transcriptional regulator, partial [Gemmatimonadaceae bacterium]|nr:BTAD domain-containing putative transcriptional regulator [Gemmatimonadaceae bacterium]
HARDALNQAIRHLRLELGADVVISRGAQDVGIDHSRLWCDAVAFRSALVRNELDSAIALYHGALLAGFFTSGAAPEFDQWLAAEREVLADQFGAALQQRADEATAYGDHALAVRHMRALGAAKPHSGRVACRLMETLVASGDRDSALEVAAQYALRVRQELEVEPDPRVAALAGELRTRPLGSSLLLATSQASEPRKQEVAMAKVGRRPGIGMRALIGGAAFTALPLAVALILRGGSATGAATLAARDSNLIAVAPFDVLSSEHELWREGLVDLVSSELDGAGPLRSVSPSIVIRRWSGHADAASALALGTATGATFVVYGSVVTTGWDSVRITTRILDVVSGAANEIEVRDLGTRLDRVADSLSVRILRELGRTRPIAAVPRAGFASQSWAAIKAYLAGEQFYRHVMRDSAMVYYTRAVSLDTTFALAWWKMARVRSMGVSEADDTVSMYGLRAGSLNHGLSPRDSLLVVAESLYAVGQGMWGRDKVPRLHATLEEATRRFPNDAEAWFQLGRARVYAPLIGTTPEQTLMAIDRAIQVDSSFAPAFDWVSAVKISLRLDSIGAARRHLLLGAGWEPPRRRDGMRFAVAMLADSPAGLRVLNRWVDTATTEAIDAAAHALEDWPDSAEVAVHLRRVLLSRARAAADTSAVDEHLLNLRYALARRGHLRESYSIYEGRPGPFFTQIALFGAVPASDVAARATLEPQGPLAWFAQQHDTVAVKSALRLLDSIAQPKSERTDSPTPGWDVARGRAYLALARGDTAEAISRFIPVIDSLCPGCSFSRTYVDIYSAAPLLQSRGLDRKAATWLDYNNTTVLRPVFDVWFALARGRAWERLYEREKAMAAYRFVTASWEHADPALQVHVAEARAGLRRLGAAAAR